MPQRNRVASLLIALLFLVPHAAADEPTGTDRHGDPLPPGAVRDGTVRLRHGTGGTDAALLAGRQAARIS